MMKRIGILGGTSPESTVSYYQRITREYTQRFGTYAYPEILIYSVSFQKFVDWQKAKDWGAMAAEMIHIFQVLAKAGAQIGLIAANTLHRVFDTVEQSSSITLIHIADATAGAIRAQGCTRVALLGTRYTMEEPFYRDRLAQYGIATMIPSKEEREVIHRVIYDELTRGIVRPDSKADYIQIINRLATEGAEGAVLGCTEIPLLVREGDCVIPLFDTATIHADAALDAAIC
jgi:aspartate racemase